MRRRQRFVSLALWVFVLLLMCVAACVFSMSTEQKAAPTGGKDAVTVFLTGYELGALKPCGCSGGQLGGLDRRSAVFESVPRERRLVIDTGGFVESSGPQEQIKFSVIFQAFRLLGYDIVNLREEDLKLAREMGMLEVLSSGLHLITAETVPEANMPAGFTKEYSLGEESLALTVASLDTEQQPLEKVNELFALDSGEQSVNLLILDKCDQQTIDFIKQVNVVDCLLIPPEADRPILSESSDDGLLVISSGRLGKYVGKLQINPGRQGRERFGFTAVPVTEDMPPKEPLVQLYKAYQQFVKEANLLQRHPRYALSGSLEYTGSQKCKSCHGYEYSEWCKKAHADAYATLENVGSQYDPECVVCHVVGFDYESGFISPEKTSHLKDVGCENCHGPGSKHVNNWGGEELGDPKMTCLDCHTPEHSGEYAGHEQEYFGKIVHWREPNAVGNVE